MTYKMSAASTSSYRKCSTVNHDPQKPIRQKFHITYQTRTVSDLTE